MKKLFACWLVLAAGGCPEVTVDPGEVGSSPTVEFDPARSLATKARFIPFPNDLVRDPMTGRIALGEQACETAVARATRENILNQLDGFGTYQAAMQVTFTEAVDPTSLIANGNVVMYQRTDGGAALDPAVAAQVPVIVQPGTTLRVLEGACSSPEVVNSITIVPVAPLAQNSSYVVAVLDGVKTTNGEDFQKSYTWSLVSGRNNPVTLDAAGNVVSDRTPLDPADPAQLAQLRSLDLLWKAHDPALAFLEATPGGPLRQDTLVAFQLTTQTTTSPLDPSDPGSVAAGLSNAAFVAGPATATNTFGLPTDNPCTDPSLSSPETNPTQCFLKLVLGGCNPRTTGCSVANYNVGNATCTSLGCAFIGDVLGAGLVQAAYQRATPNTLAGGAPIPGAWSDPIHPDPQASVQLEVLFFVPPGTAPSAGWPIVVFGHGLGSSKEALFAIAASFARAGLASVAIDFQLHGSRAVRTSRDIGLGCIGRCASGGTPYARDCDTVADCTSPLTDTCGVAGAPGTFVPPSPTSAPQCYAPFFAPDLAATRDGFRQTILDLERLVRALKTCGATGCGALKVNNAKLLYTGQSLGAILGTAFIGLQPDIKASVLNVGAVGWLDLLENTESLAIRCSLVDSLIDLGFLTGDHWNKSTTSPTGLCSTPDWKKQPGYATFAAIGRWVIDPADPANFAAKAAQRRLLIQEVIGDQVVPNLGTGRQAALVGLGGMATPGSLFLPPSNIGPSTAIVTNPMTNKWLTYTTDATNAFEHPSLLRPSAGTAGAYGTGRLQTDAITFLSLNQ